MRQPSTPTGNNGNAPRARTRGAIRTHLGRKRTGPRGRTLKHSTLERISEVTGNARREQEDFFGRNVILAARIAASARGDQILVSSLLREIVSSAGEFDFGQPRDEQLKGLSEPQRLYEVAWAPTPAPA